MVRAGLCSLHSRGRLRPESHRQHGLDLVPLLHTVVAPRASTAQSLRWAVARNQEKGQRLRRCPFFVRAEEPSVETSTPVGFETSGRSRSVRIFAKEPRNGGAKRFPLRLFLVNLRQEEPRYSMPGEPVEPLISGSCHSLFHRFAGGHERRGQS